MLVALVVAYTYFRRGAPAGTILILAAVGMSVLLIAFLFSRLHVEVTEQDLIVRFGPGWQAKKVPLEMIEEIDVVQYPWYYGWGIRLTPKGTLYNVSGTRAVHLRLGNGNQLLVGSDEPERLAAVLVAQKSGA